MDPDTFIFSEAAVGTLRCRAPTTCPPQTRRTVSGMNYRAACNSDLFTFHIQGRGPGQESPGLRDCAEVLCGPPPAWSPQPCPRPAVCPARTRGTVVLPGLVPSTGGERRSHLSMRPWGRGPCPANRPFTAPWLLQSGDQQNGSELRIVRHKTLLA